LRGWKSAALGNLRDTECALLAHQREWGCVRGGLSREWACGGEGRVSLEGWGIDLGVSLEGWKSAALGNLSATKDCTEEGVHSRGSGAVEGGSHSGVEVGRVGELEGRPQGAHAGVSLEVHQGYIREPRPLGGLVLLPRGTTTTTHSRGGHAGTGGEGGGKGGQGTGQKTMLSDSRRNQYEVTGKPLAHQHARGVQYLRVLGPVPAGGGVCPQAPGPYLQGAHCPVPAGVAMCRTYRGYTVLYLKVRWPYLQERVERGARVLVREEGSHSTACGSRQSIPSSSTTLPTLAMAHRWLSPTAADTRRPLEGLQDGVVVVEFQGRSEVRRRLARLPRACIAQHRAGQGVTGRHSTAQHSTAQHSTAQHRETRMNTQGAAQSFSGMESVVVVPRA